MSDFVALKSTRGRLVVLATVLGSGTVFLESTVVNVALPSMGRDLHLGMAGLQNNIHLSPLIAGAALLPVNVLMLVLSPISCHIATRIGARLPMTIGAAVAGVGMILFAGIVSFLTVQLEELA